MTIEEVRIGQRFKCKKTDLRRFGIGTAILLCEDGDIGLRNAAGEQIIVNVDDLIPEEKWKKPNREKKGEKQEYTVSMRVDGRVNVMVEASSFEEALKLAKEEEYDPTEVECVEYEPVNATDSHGILKDYR